MLICLFFPELKTIAEIRNCMFRSCCDALFAASREVYTSPQETNTRLLFCNSSNISGGILESSRPICSLVFCNSNILWLDFCTFNSCSYFSSRIRPAYSDSCPILSFKLSIYTCCFPISLENFSTSGMLTACCRT